MCGLFGSMSSVLVKDEINKTVQLGHLSVFRGIDSTGIAVVREVEKNKKVRLAYTTSKAPLPSPVFFFDETYNAPLDYEELRVIMGHTRAATIGDLNTKNAHPHHFKHIIGCHNGTIRALNLREEDKKLGSDSRVLFREIAEQGLSEALKRAAHGAYAISYLDTSNSTLNFIRNHDRTLFFGYNGSKTTLYWASERRFLEFVGIKDIDWVPNDILHTFKIGNIKEVKKVELNPRPTVIYRGGHNLGGHASRRKDWDKDLTDYYGDWTEEATSLKDDTFRPPWMSQETVEEERASENKRISEEIRMVNEEVKGELLRLPPFRDEGPDTPLEDPLTHLPKHLADMSYQIRRGELITLEEAQHHLDGGCGWCQKPMRVEDPVWWANEIEWYCQSCYERDFIKFYYHAHQLEQGKIIRLALA